MPSSELQCTTNLDFWARSQSGIGGVNIENLADFQFPVTESIGTRSVPERHPAVARNPRFGPSAQYCDFVSQSFQASGDLSDFGWFLKLPHVLFNA
jgi:hypothetical protein